MRTTIPTRPTSQLELRRSWGNGPDKPFRCGQSVMTARALSPPAGAPNLRRSSSARRGTMAFAAKDIAIDGCRLSVRRGGGGVPLLYLHGTDGLAEWPALLDR